MNGLQQSQTNVLNPPKVKLVLDILNFTKISFQLLSSNYKNYSYLCTWTISLLLFLSKFDVFFHGLERDSLRRAEYGGVTYLDKAVQSGKRVDIKIVQT